MSTSTQNISLDFTGAALRLKKIVNRTPLQFNHNLSRKYDCNIYLKREDLQVVRSYKLRGAYNMMSSLPKEQLQKGVVCASAGNHAQGFAYSCKKLNVKGVVFTPVLAAVGALAALIGECKLTVEREEKPGPDNK